MANSWHKHPFPLLLYLEWILLGIALVAAFSGFITHSRHHPMPHPAGFNLLGIFCLAILAIAGWCMPFQSQFMQWIYVIGNFLVSWMAIAFIARGERIFPALLLVVVVRGCLLFSWSGRIFVATLAYVSFLAIQVMSIMRISFLGIPLGRPLPPMLRRLPPQEFRRVWFGLLFNSALLFALVLAFVLLLVGAVIAEHESRKKLVLANCRLRQYAQQIEDKATLQERNRIAREIHDSVGHYLTAQSIQLENTAVFLVKDQNKAASHLAKARQLGKDALTNIRASVATLRHNPLEERSLKKALESLILEFESNTNIAIASNIDLVSALPMEIKTALYRLVQEALTNITKHSQANQVQLDLNETPEKILLTVRDNGRGFNRQDNTTGFGLQSMEERVIALRGKILIASQNGHGCRIRIEIPLSTPSY